MELPRGVQEAGAPAERDGTADLAGHRVAQALELGEREAVHEGLDGDVARGADLCEQGVDGGGHVGRTLGDLARAAHLDAVRRHDGGLGSGTVVEQAARGDLGGLHVGLVERVDLEQAARDGDGVLPREDLRAERAADDDLALGRVVRVDVGDEPRDLQVGQVERQLGGVGRQHDGQEARAELAGGLRDELLDPLAEAHDVRAVGDDAELVLERRGAGDRGAEHEARVRHVVDGELRGRGLRLVEQAADVGAGEAGRHQAERGQRAVAAAHVGVRVEDAVAVGAGRLVERGARVGHDDDARGRVDARLAERLLVDALLAVRLERGSGLRGDDDRRGGEAVAERGEHLARVGRVEDRELDARGAGDDLGRERGTAHAAEDDVVDALAAELLAERRDLGHQRTGDGDRLRPAEALGGLGLGVRSPERAVQPGDAGGVVRLDEGGDVGLDGRGRRAAQRDAHAHLAPSRAVVTVSMSSLHDTLNFSTPSFSRSSVTSL